MLYHVLALHEVVSKCPPSLVRSYLSDVRDSVWIPSPHSQVTLFHCNFKDTPGYNEKTRGPHCSIWEFLMCIHRKSTHGSWMVWVRLIFPRQARNETPSCDLMNERWLSFLRRAIKPIFVLQITGFGDQMMLHHHDISAKEGRGEWIHCLLRGAKSSRLSW